MATNLKFLPELIPLVIDMDRGLLHPEHWGKMELLSALSKDEDNWLKDMRISCMEEYIQYMYKRICSITGWGLIDIPHILNTQNLINIIHHLKIYNVSDEDIKISKNINRINIIVKNMRVDLSDIDISYYMDNQYHCTFGPAYIYWYNSGKKQAEYYYICNGKSHLHRKNGPAYIQYHSNRVTAVEIYYMDNLYHRTDGPARVMWDQTGVKTIEEYYIKGYRHSTVGPAQIEWYKDGVKKYEKYYINDMIHRTDGPAHTSWHRDGVKGIEEYYILNQLNRLIDEPTIIKWDNNGFKYKST